VRGASEVFEDDQAVRLGDGVARCKQRVALAVEMDREGVAGGRIGACRDAGDIPQCRGDRDRARMVFRIRGSSVRRPSRAASAYGNILYSVAPARPIQVRAAAIVSASPASAAPARPPSPL